MSDHANADGDLYRIFLNGEGRTRRVHKWHHYFTVYERFLAPFRGRRIRLLEIGVQRGGSLEMWRAYLGPQAHIIGIDVDPACAAYGDANTQVFIGSQEDPGFIARVIAETGPPDLVIDDGGHTASQQIVSFETIYPLMPVPGVYLVEDTHTAFWGGRFADRYDGRSLLDYAFDRCRSLHEWTMRQAAFERYGEPPESREGFARPVSEFCRRTGAISFFDSIVVFERAERTEPWHDVR